MKFPLISFGTLLFTSLLGLGEPAWIVWIIVASCLAIFRAPSLPLRSAVVAIGVSALTLHFLGYKLYGSATIYDNRSILDSPRQLASFGAPNLVVLSDGSSIPLSGLDFKPELFTLPLATLSLRLNRSSNFPVLIRKDPTSSSGGIVQRRIHYFCGNTFFPTFLPRRLPAYRSEDLGLLLVDLGFATPRRAP